MQFKKFKNQIFVRLSFLHGKEQLKNHKIQSNSIRERNEFYMPMNGNRNHIFVVNRAQEKRNEYAYRERSMEHETHRWMKLNHQQHSQGN